MDIKIAIEFESDEIPNGMARADDFSNIVTNLQDVVANIVHVDLGYSLKKRLRKDAISKSTLLVSDLKAKCTEITLKPFESNEGMAPAEVAILSLSKSLIHHKKHGVWPSYLPIQLRHKLSKTTKSLVSSGINPKITFSNGDKTIISLVVDKEFQEILEKEDVSSPDSAVEIIGRIVAMDIKNLSFKIDCGDKTCKVSVDEWTFRKIDSEHFRWQTVRIIAFASDDTMRTFQNIKDIERADDSDAPCISIIDKANNRLNESSEIKERMMLLRNLQNGWNGPHSLKMQDSQYDYSLQFIKDLYFVLDFHKIEIYPPFIAPTNNGWIQLEWENSKAVLELEIIDQDKFHYLLIDEIKSTEIEESCERYKAIQLVKNMMLTYMEGNND